MDHDALDVAQVGKRYLLARDEDGWAVWDKDDEDPIARFSDDDAGYQRAADIYWSLERTTVPWLNVLRWVAFVAGAIWILSNAYFSYEIMQATQTQGSFDSFTWVEAAQRASYPVFLVAVAAYVILWLRDNGSPR